MKKIIIFIILLTSAATWYGESRKFFCSENGQCVTVWKTYNNICYIIPGKYYGVTKPSKNFMESTNTNSLTVFFTNEMPNAFIFLSEQDLKIYNTDTRKFIFYDYNLNKEKFHNILYKPDAKKANDIKQNAALIDIYILENYATDKNGKKL